MLHQGFKIQEMSKDILAEYKFRNIIAETISIEEVKDSCMDKRIVNKVSKAGNNILVEDSIFFANREKVIPNMIDLLYEYNKKELCEWIVNIAIMENDIIYIYRGITAIDINKNQKCKDLWQLISPAGEQMSFFDLIVQDIYSVVSPRNKAINRLLQKEYCDKRLRVN